MRDTAIPPASSTWPQVIPFLPARLTQAHLALLAVGTLILAIGVFIVAVPRAYSAVALVAPTQARVKVQFEPKILTVDPGSQQPASGSASIPPERLQALADLVASPQLESQVITDVSGRVSSSELKPGDLLDRVHGTLKPRSEIIGIEIRAATPEDSVLLTNAWATRYVQMVNRVYAGGDSGQDFASLVTQSDDLLKQSQIAQAALAEDFKTSRLAEVDTAIADKQHVLTLLSSDYATMTGGSPQSATTTDAQTARTDFRLAEVRTVDELAQVLRRLDATRQSLQALLAQDDAGRRSSSTAAAMALAKTQLVALSDGLPAGTQIQLPAVPTSDQSDPATLVSAIDSARAQVAQEFDARRTAYESHRAQETAQIFGDLRALAAESEALTAHRKELTLKRDLAWQTYSAVANKVEERRVAEATSGREVELASQAVVGQPVSRASLALLIVLACAGIAVALLVLLGTRRGMSGRLRGWPAEEVPAALT